MKYIFVLMLQLSFVTTSPGFLYSPDSVLLLSKSLEWAVISKPAANKCVLCLCCYKRCVKVTRTFVILIAIKKSPFSPETQTLLFSAH